MTLPEAELQTRADHFRPMIDEDTFEQNRGRQAWVRRHRDELMQLTGLEIPQSLSAVETWRDGHQSHLTKRMREHYTPDELDETDSAETNGGDN